MNFVCEACGRPVTQTIIHHTASNRILYICERCAGLNGYCFSCTMGGVCEFTDNPDPTPKQITIRKEVPGGYTMGTVTNPEREKKFCEPCKCWFDGACCRRENEMTCSNYLSVFEKIAGEKEKE